MKPFETIRVGSNQDQATQVPIGEEDNFLGVVDVIEKQAWSARGFPGRITVFPCVCSESLFFTG